MTMLPMGRVHFLLLVVFPLAYRINEANARSSVACSVQFGLAESVSLNNSNASVSDQCLLSSFNKGICALNSRTRLNCQCQPTCQHITLCLKNCSQQQAQDMTGESTACIEPSNVTMLQSTLKLLQLGFGWNRALVLVDGSCPICDAAASTDGVSLINTTSKTDWKTKIRLYKILVVFYVNKMTATEVLCEAYRQELFYSSGYAWVIVGVDVDELLNTTSDMLLSMNCTLDMIKTVLNYTLVVEPAVTENDTKNCGLQKVLRETENNIKRDCLRTSELTNNITVTMDITTEEICDHQNRTAAVVFQYRQFQDFDIDKLIVAAIDKSCAASDYFLVLTNCENQTTIFPDGVPSDVSRVRVQDATHIATLIVTMVLYGFLFAFAIGCLLFNILLRNRRVVKLTSPALNCVMIAGAVLLGTAIILYTVPIHTTDILPFLCISRFGALVFGHDICFGIIVAKLIRIHHIFRNPSAKKKPIKDWHLLLGLGTILGIEAVVFISLQAVAFTVTIEHGDVVNRENPMTIDAMGVIEEHYIIICGNPPPDYAIVVFTVTVKLALHVTAIVLAIRTRNIEVEAVNYAKETQALAYISTVYLILLVLFNFTLEGYANAYGLAVGACAYLGSFTFLGLTFVPKMVVLCKDPMGKNLFKTENPTQLTTSTLNTH